MKKLLIVTSIGLFIVTSIGLFIVTSIGLFSYCFSFGQNATNPPGLTKTVLSVSQLLACTTRFLNLINSMKRLNGFLRPIKSNAFVD